MQKENVNSKVISSLIWKMLEKIGTQGISFLIQILLARLLLPSDYGTIALVMVFISIANVFVQSGFSTALIQKKGVEEVDYSSVFYVSLLTAIICYVGLYFVAPYIANFYGDNAIVPLLRVLSVSLFIGVFNSIQIAIISKHMQFKKMFYSSLISIFISGTIGIALAYQGFGAWALVAQYLFNQVIMAIILYLQVRWRPRLIFSLKRVKGLFSFGWKILAATLIDVLYVNLSSLIVGKIYGPDIVGYYTRGMQFPQTIVRSVNGSIQSVMLSALSAEQDNRQRVKGMMRRSIVTSSFAIFPVMIGLAVIAEPLVTILLTEAWLPCVPYIQIFCISFAFWPIHTSNLQAINAMGRSDVSLKLEIVKKVVGISILAISISFHSPYAIAIATMLTSIISTFINSYPNKKILDYSFLEQMRDILPSLSLSVVMGVLICSINWPEVGPMLLIILQVIFGGAIYLLLAKIFKLECFEYLLVQVKKIINR